jgi:hypothetical protein
MDASPGPRCADKNSSLFRTSTEPPRPNNLKRGGVGGSAGEASDYGSGNERDPTGRDTRRGGDRANVVPEGLLSLTVRGATSMSENICRHSWADDIRSDVGIWR